MLCPQTGVVPQPEELREHVKQSLPEFMVPAAVVVLEAFPLTPNGKINRQALPAPDYAREDVSTYVAPRNFTEERIAAVWSEVLRVPQVGALDDFFATGGHSLLATQVISRIRQIFRVEIPLRAIFEFPSRRGWQSKWMPRCERNTILNSRPCSRCRATRSYRCRPHSRACGSWISLIQTAPPTTFLARTGWIPLSTSTFCSAAWMLWWPAMNR